MRPMSEAPKDRTPILARIRADLATAFPHYGFTDSGASRHAGLYVVIRHPGLADDGFDVGWGLAGPFGIGLGGDEVFEGWWPLPETTSAARP